MLLLLLLSLYCSFSLPIPSVAFCTSCWKTGRCQSIAKLNDLQAGRFSTRGSIPDRVQRTSFSKSENNADVASLSVDIQGPFLRVNRPGLETVYIYQCLSQARLLCATCLNVKCLVSIRDNFQTTLPSCWDFTLFIG